MVNSLPSRRTLLSGVAAGGVALPLLAACGSNNSDATGTSGSAGSSASTGTSGSSGALAKTTDIPVGGGKIFDAQKVVVTQPTKGEFKAFSAVCTHQGCLVTSVSGGEIHCPCHGSAFSVSNGAVKAGPAPSPLPAEKIKVSGDEITLA